MAKTLLQIAVLPKLRSALYAARKIPKRGSTDVEDVPAPAYQSKPDEYDDDDDII